MRILFAAALLALPVPAIAAPACSYTPREIATRFMTQFYVDKQVRAAFETWVDPGYIQHNPYAATGRDAAIAFLEPFLRDPAVHYDIRRVIADGNMVVVHSHGWMKANDPGVAVVDILRIDHCKVVEHWDVVQPVPAQSANTNTMF